MLVTRNTGSLAPRQRRLGRSGGGRDRARPKHPAPAAREAPARSEPGHPSGEAARLEPDRDGVTVGTTIALREDPIEDKRGGDDSQHEDRHEHRRENRRIGHDGPPSTNRRGTPISGRGIATAGSRYSRCSTCTHGSTYATPSSRRSMTTSVPAATAVPSRLWAGVAYRFPPTT